MRTRLRTIVATLLAGAALAFAGAVAVVWLGIYNVSAQRGHWPGVGWVLHTTFGNSVRLRAPSMDEALDLSDADLIALGAGHYATACAPCHAAPGEDRLATVRNMAPEPPHILDAIEGWKPNHLHWIVENGAKMTGMPAWPAEGRSDEVWAVVAYLEALRQNAAPSLPGPADIADSDLAYCQTCHGRIGGKVPRLDIQDAAYLEAALHAYATGERPSGIMAQAASLVSDESFADLAAHFAGAGQEGSARPSAPPATGGAVLATRGTRDVPACTACHGPGRERTSGEGRRFPALAGQNSVFLATQLVLWRDGVLNGSPLMTAAARDLTDEQINAIADWFAAQAPEVE